MKTLTPRTQRRIEILLIEDNPADALLMRRALRQGKMANHLQVVSDGGKAMAYLRRAAPFSRAARPDIILLDLNLPRRDGQAVLEELKADPKLKRIPVVLLTTSHQDDIAHVNCSINKPVDLNDFLNVLHSIEDFWLTIVKPSDSLS